jgi:Spy/CpxP family protein refolding chaperone
MKKCLLFSMVMIGCLTLAIGQSHTSMRMPHPAAGMQGMPPAAPEAMTPPIQAVQEFLGLTADQVKKWEDLQQAKRDQMDDQRDQIRALDEQLQEQLKLDNPAPATVGDLVIKLHKAREQGNQLTIAFADQVRALLTSEQMKKLETVEQCIQVQKIMGALFATGFLAPPPPPPRPAPLPPGAPVPHMP